MEKTTEISDTNVDAVKRMLQEDDAGGPVFIMTDNGMFEFDSLEDAQKWLALNDPD